METTFLLHAERMEYVEKSTGRSLGLFDLDSPVMLNVEIAVSGGQEAITDGPPERCQPGYGPDVELIKAFVGDEPMTLINTEGVELTFPPGYDITERLSRGAQDSITEEVEIPAADDDYEPYYDDEAYA
jgi:hypothetical protein